MHIIIKQVYYKFYYEGRSLVPAVRSQPAYCTAIYRE
jgi:hypothetical protein